MTQITVDGQEYEVRDGDNLLQACLSHGLDLPYFCWHPAMDSVGACRQCAVIAYQDADDERGRLTMACMTPVSDGARIDIKAAHAEEFRASVIEWLMENHPHDCPVCEEGGECHLQDMTVMTGHTARRYTGAKRTFENQYLGPFVNHEMNRCITCYRCVRFYRDYAGGTDLDAFGSRSRMYFGRAEPGVLESEFSGNLVEVCPTGVFTDKPFSAMYSRKWDLQSAPSICSGCSLGCNIFASERYGALKRIHNRYHADLNRYFICDRGRFGMAYTNSDARIRLTGERSAPGVFRQILPVDATTRAAELLGSGRVVGIGSPRASLEDNFALRKLVGAENFCAGMSDSEATLMHTAAAVAQHPQPTLAEVEGADAVLVLGEDLLDTAPRLALAIRQAARNESKEMAVEANIPLWQDAGVRGHAQHAANPISIASVLPTRLQDIATYAWQAPPAQLAQTAVQIAQRVSASGTAIPTTVHSDPEQVFIEGTAAALARAQRPLIVVGVSAGEPGLLQAAGAILEALAAPNRTPGLLTVGAEANSFGVHRFAAGKGMQATLEGVIAGEAETLIVLANDLYRRAPASLVDQALQTAANVVVLDSLDNATGEQAHLVFPTATVAESTGTMVNYEGRAQRYYQVFEPADDVLPGWRWITQIAAGLGRTDLDWQHVDEVLADLDSSTQYRGVAAVAPGADFRSVAGQKVPRESHRYSGRTAMHADKTMHEPKTTVDEDTPFSYSMEGSNRDQAGSLIPYVWSPGWNSNQSLFKFQHEVGGALRGGDPGVRLDAIGVQNEPGLMVQPVQPTHAEGFELISMPTVFGSEELSAYSPAIESRMPFPYIVLNPDDATDLGVEEGGGVRCQEQTLEVRTDGGMRRGYAAVPVGLPDAPRFITRERVALQRDPDFVKRPTIIARG